jgi:hypothetical protein
MNHLQADLAKKVLERVYRTCVYRLAKYRDFFPGGLPMGELSLLVKTLRLLVSSPYFSKEILPPTSLLFAAPSLFLPSSSSSAAAAASGSAYDVMLAAIRMGCLARYQKMVQDSKSAADGGAAANGNGNGKQGGEETGNEFVRLARIAEWIVGDLMDDQVYYSPGIAPIL